ncbi:POZ domain-containing protein [Gigaspora margarita]|uniref:POZ domain-containing protein n=1 Tax=Gigaspora margarita TaxID=4874 RepID=A0A8H3X905_GIGMA|nr:POZ domain-containing protein [Gigaspora margarita]
MIKNFIQNFNISTTSLTSFATPPNTSYLSTSITNNINIDTKNDNIDNSDERSILTESLASKDKIVLNVGVPTIDQAIGLIPISAAELEDEVEYFKIPTYPPSQYSSSTLSPNQLSLRHKMIASEIDSFIETLTSTLLTISSQFKREIFFKRNFQIYFEINFHNNDRITDFNIFPNVPSTLKQQLQKEFDAFSVLGYAILDKFGEDIGRYMISNVQGCTWDCNKTKDVGWGGVHEIYKVKIGVENSFEHEDVVGHCCLANIGNESGIGSP